MEGNDVINFSSIGNNTGEHYSGNFKVKAFLTRRDYFLADQRRREIIGSTSPENAMSALVGEAFMLGQLRARILEGPAWWGASDGGLDLRDSNVIEELFKLALQVQDKAQTELKEKAKEALQKLAAAPAVASSATIPDKK